MLHRLKNHMREFQSEQRGEKHRSEIQAGWQEQHEHQAELAVTNITSIIQFIKSYEIKDEITKIKKIARDHHITNEILQLAVAEGIPKLCYRSHQEGDYDLLAFREVIRSFNLEQAMYRSPQIKGLILFGFEEFLFENNFPTGIDSADDDDNDYEQHSQNEDDLLKFKFFESTFREMGFDKQEYRMIGEHTIISHLERGFAASGARAAQKFQIERAFFDTPDAQHAIVQGFLKALNQGFGYQMMKITETFPNIKLLLISLPNIQDKLQECFKQIFFHRRYKESAEFASEFNIEIDQNSLLAIYFDDSVPRSIRNANETYYHHDNEDSIQVEHQRARLTHGLMPDEYRNLLMKHPELSHASAAKQEASRLLCEHFLNSTGEEKEIGENMQRFARLFGEQTTIDFANRPDLSRHDAFLSGNLLLPFMEAQGIDHNDPKQIEQFSKKFRSVLLQVAQDDARYDSSNAHQKFNDVMRTISTQSIEKTIRNIEQLGIPELTKRAEKLRNGRFQALTSWNGLKEAETLIRVLQRRDMMQVFQHSNAPDSVKNYVFALLEHPTIEMDALNNFLVNPLKFLDAKGSFVDTDLQKSLSPARMLSVERLGLTAEDIRDALVDGTMDILQLLPPSEQTFVFDANGDDIYTDHYLQKTFSRAIGREREGVKGKAHDPKLLFSDLLQWGRSHDKSKNDCIAWLRAEQSFELTQTDRDELTRLLHASGRGVPQTDGTIVRIRLGKKSDPSMMVAGNDTKSCMPFGDGKTNVYAWNPNCAQLVVERKMEDGTWRTMAQSVVMLDVDIKKFAGGVIADVRSGKQLTEILTADVFASLPLIVCDNIEPSPNDIEAGRSAIIEKTYQSFFKFYLAQYAPTLGVNATEVIIGKESYATGRPDWSFPQTSNTYLPLAPVSYTDNAGTIVYRMTTGLEHVQKEQATISTVTAANILPMSYLESKNFADNPNLILGLYDRQHKIVGASITREKHGDPNLCLMSRDENSVPVGYIIAYMDRTTDVPEVFIDDMAVDRSRNVLAARHAVRLLKTFLDIYAKHYQHSEIPFPPIFAQMRERTSYKLFKRQAETLSKEYQLELEISEEGETSLGGEIFKHVRVFVGKTQAQLKATQEAFQNRKPRQRTHRDD